MCVCMCVCVCVCVLQVVANLPAVVRRAGRAVSIRSSVLCAYVIVSPHCTTHNLDYTLHGGLSDNQSVPKTSVPPFLWWSLQQTRNIRCGTLDVPVDTESHSHNWGHSTPISTIYTVF